jgi:alpha-L-rhamnosidase
LEGGKGGPYHYGIVDWPMNMRYGYDTSVESRTVVDAYAYLDFDIMSKVAELLGHSVDRDTFNWKANAMKKAINSRLINQDGVYIDGLNHNQTQSSHVSQHANIFPLAMGIVPEKNVNQVLTEVKNRQMNVGMVCLRWLPEALGQADQGPHLIDLYTNTKWDGWAKIIAIGGTVTWEAWDANQTNESMSHPWGAVGLLAMQQYILGIKPLKPQHELVQIKPLAFEDKLNHAMGIYATDRGDIKIDWNKVDSLFSMTISIPDNITAKVYVPRGASDGTLIKVDGVDVEGVKEGRYMLIENVGSGFHTFLRNIGFQ